MSAVWTTTVSRFEEARDAVTGEVDTMKFVAACEAISGVYDGLFGSGKLAGQLKGDIMNSSSTVRKAFLKNPDKCGTLRSMVQFELATVGRDKVRVDKTSGIIGMLWAKRAVQFISIFLELLGARPDLTGPQCARETYDRVLSKYHGWLTATALSAVFGFAPSKQDIFSKLGLSPVTAPAQVAAFVSVIRDVELSVQALLDEFDLDFPDKV